MARIKRSFGGLRRLPSGRYQANYTGPDTQLHNAPYTFVTREDAEAWLTDIRRQISSGEWTPKVIRPQTVTTFDVYSTRWLERRTLKPRTRGHYAYLLEHHLTPVLGEMSLRTIDAADVTDWYAGLDSTRPTLRAHCYGLLRTILASAVQDRLLDYNPCHIRGAGNSKRVHKIKPLTLPELEDLVAAMPARLQAMTLLAAWCAMRFGELTELRRTDLNLTKGIIHVRRAVVRVDGQVIIGTPKSEAGTRDIAIPPHLMPLLKTHLSTHVSPGKDALLFPSATGGHLAPSSLYGRPDTPTKTGYGFYKARVTAQRPDLRWHDLRHTGAVLAASTGATLAELMGRLGHSTPGAALRYQHAAQGRDMEIAIALSALAAGSKPEGRNAV
jgi:integrase